MTDLVHRLIGCCWGHPWSPVRPGRDSPAEDQVPCPEQASTIIALHIGPADVEGTAVKLCPRHASIVVEETRPRSDPVEP